VRAALGVEVIAIEAMPIVTDAAIKAMVRKVISDSSLGLLGLITMPNTVPRETVAFARPMV
jgi:hypothetical protein